MTPRAVRVSAKRGKKCKMMKEPQTYLSDMRPRFDPFVIDCGKIPAYRYRGSLRSELESKTLDRGGSDRDPRRYADQFENSRR